MAAGKRTGMAGRRPGSRRREPGGRCSTCRKHKDKVHRNRQTGHLVCATCADRARMRVGPCAECGERKLLQARSRCYACYKREWRSARRRILLARPARRVRRLRPVL
jgi:predicted amidophosphoribosyltransferase